MKKNRKKSITRLYKKQIVVIMIVTFMAIITIISTLIIKLNRNKENGSLTNVLKNQKMLIQEMVQDCYKISDLQLNNSQPDAQEKLQKAFDNLQDSVNKYDSMYNKIKGGYITAGNKIISCKDVMEELKPALEEHDRIWMGYKKNIAIILSDRENTNRLIDATRYIDENDEALTEASNKIVHIILRHTDKVNQFIIYQNSVLEIVFLLILVVIFFNSYKNYFIFLNQLRSGLSNYEINGTKNEEANPLFSEAKDVFNKLQGIIKLTENINKNVPFRDILDYIFDSFSEYIPYTYIGVALIEDDGKTIKASYSSTGSANRNIRNKFLGYKTDINSTSLGKIIKSGEVRIINDLEKYVKEKCVNGKTISYYNKSLLDIGIRSSITFPLISNNKPVGIIFFSSNCKNVYKPEHVKFLKIIAGSIMLSLEEDILIEDMIVSSTLALATLAEARDPETGEHLERMKKYAGIIAGLLSKESRYENIIDIDYINDIERFSPLHDIGKVAIQDEILLKPGKLTPEEFEIMKTHATYGGKVLRMAEDNIKKSGRSVFGMAIEIAEGHHEKWDGTGYPYGKKGEEIPLCARIVAVADVLDALTSKRPYKKALTFEQSSNIIIQDSGKHFDPYIVDIFYKNIDILKKCYESLNINDYE